MPLESFYSGDEVWAQYIVRHQEAPRSGERFDLRDFPDLGEIQPDATELLQVAVSKMGVERVRWWLREPVPALEGETPFDCIFVDGSNNMIKRMREYLMRCPT